MEFLSEIISRESFVIEYGSHIMDSIMIVLDGQFTFSVHGIDYVAGKNDVCIFPKDTLFERRVQQKIKCVYIQFENFPMILKGGILSTTDEERTESTITYLVKAVEEKNDLLAKHFLMDILYMHNSPCVVENSDEPIISACITYFSRNFAQSISLDMLSEKFFISKQGLIRKFKKYARKTPMEYLNFIRINYGKLLLHDTTLSIGEIAEKCGFENIYYFSSRFKFITKVSPSAYRKQREKQIL